MTTETPTTDRRGGRRTGAGRPKVTDKRISISLRISSQTKAWLDQQPDSYGKAIERLIRSQLHPPPETEA